MKKYLFSVVVFLFCCMPAISWANEVIPRDHVTRGVNIRSEPSASSESLGLLRPGQTLPFHASIPRWYSVELPNGEIGFLWKASTLLIESEETEDESVAGEQIETTYILDVVDVGTGLAVIVQGHDFFAIYDGGSNDDKTLGEGNRLLAYLRAEYPDLETIDHMVLSHPHTDHVLLLPDLFDQYSVANVWDSGRKYDICGYRALLNQIASNADTAYHNAVVESGVHSVPFRKKLCFGVQLPAETITVETDEIINNDILEIGDNAEMQFLYADGGRHSSPNENSLVLSMRLGDVKVLFMGDAEAGGREDPSVSPTSKSIEGVLVTCCSEELQSDILIAGHHGSMTSSRAAFLDHVQADYYVVSSGPKRYSGVTLPDENVLQEFSRRGEIWRTDNDDEACKESASKIGPDNDNRAGGCDNIRFFIDSDGSITGELLEISD